MLFVELPESFGMRYINWLQILPIFRVKLVYCFGVRLAQSFVILPILGILAVYQSSLSVQLSSELKFRRLSFSSDLVNLECVLNSQIIHKTGILLFSLWVVWFKFIECPKVFLKSSSSSLFKPLDFLTQLVVLCNQSVLVGLVLICVMLNFNRCVSDWDLKFASVSLRILK